jgi:ElaB/YqjD/DUF883 family membrane-anchored ribosome-binding protein
MAKQVFNPDALKENIAELKEKIQNLESNFKEDMQEKTREMKKKAERKIEDNPFQSVGIAFGSGLALGALAVALMRRK